MKIKFKFSLTIGIGLICIITFMLVGCKNTNQQPEALYIDWDKIDADSILFSQFVDSISYIELETTEKSIIGKIHNVRISDSAIIVFDKKQKSVLSFFNNGKFRCKISSRGNGPEEYAYLQQIDIDPYTDEVLLFDAGKEKVMRFSFDGVFHSSDSVSCADNFGYVKSSAGDGYILTHYNTPQDKAGIFYVDRKTGEKTLLRPRRDNIERSIGTDIFRTDTVISMMTSFYENKMLEWNGDPLSVVLSFDCNYCPDSDNIGPYPGPDILKYYSRVSLVNTTRWFFACYWAENGPRLLFWDKNYKLPIVTKKS